MLFMNFSTFKNASVSRVIYSIKMPQRIFVSILRSRKKLMNFIAVASAHVSHTKTKLDYWKTSFETM